MTRHRWIASSCAAIVFVTLAVSVGVRGDAPAPDVKAAAPQPAADLSAFPTITGRLDQLLGHEGGFVRPKPGEPFRLDFAKLDKDQRVDFDPAERSYVPLAGPVSVGSVHYDGAGGFAGLRLVSAAPAPRNGRVMIDVQPLAGAGAGPRHVRVWIVFEYDGLVRGVAMLSGEADGDFPRRAK